MPDWSVNLLNFSDKNRIHLWRLKTTLKHRDEAHLAKKGRAIGIYDAIHKAFGRYELSARSQENRTAAATTQSYIFVRAGRYLFSQHLDMT